MQRGQVAIIQLSDAGVAVIPTCSLFTPSRRESRRNARKYPVKRAERLGMSVARFIVVSGMVNAISVSVNDAFDRLQRRLLAMTVGDALTPDGAADDSGLGPDVCLAVLLGLERAGLMKREEGDRFVRRSLNDA